jgi:hypothetical protein
MRLIAVAFAALFVLFSPVDVLAGPAPGGKIDAGDIPRCPTGSAHVWSSTVGYGPE